MSFLDTIKSWFSKPSQERAPEAPRDSATASTPSAAPSVTEPVVTPPTTEEPETPSEPRP
jgi:hypothetical protein